MSNSDGLLSVKQEVEAAVAEFRDKYDEARLKWIAAEMIKHIVPCMLETMTVKDYVQKMICIYEIKSHFPCSFFFIPTVLAQ